MKLKTNAEIVAKMGEITAGKTALVDWLPGENVLIGDGEIKGIISQVCFAGGRTTYEVVWWSGNTRNAQWLDAFEIQNFD